MAAAEVPLRVRAAALLELRRRQATVGQVQKVQVDLPPYASPLFEPHRYKVLWGGRGAGRSWSVARALLKQAHERPLRVLCTREFQASIKDSVHQLLQDQAALLALPFEATETEIRHPNGSLFIFKGIRYNVTKIKSLEGVDVCWVEEAERVSKESWDVLIPTIRKAGSEIWVTFNPDQESDATYQRFIVHPPPSAWVLKVSADDNPWFPDELREERDYLRRVDPDAAAHVWDGECRHATDAQVLKGKWVVEDFEVPRVGWSGPYHGADFGFAQDPCTLVRCWVGPGTDGKPGRILYLEHEAYKIGLGYDHTAEFWEHHVPGYSRYVVRADSAEPGTIDYLMRHGVPNIQGVKKWPGSIEDGIGHLRQYEQIVIHSRCKHAVEEARLYSYKVDERSGDILPAILDRHNHIWDAVRYALAPLILQRNQVAWR